VREIVGDAIANFPQMANRIELDLPPAPLLVACDQLRAVQCLNNLLSNADKYAPGDGSVVVSVHEVNGRVAIHVRDHGPGIPLSEQERVFERFYRREDPLTMRNAGAGLGLHIARSMATAMGGSLTVSTPTAGPGAEFILELAQAGTQSGPPLQPDRTPNATDTAGSAGIAAVRATQDGTMVPSDGRIAAS
jgi:signal transduction histidine kinase